MDRKYAGDLPSANGVSIDVIPSDPFPDQQADMHVRVLVQAGSDYPKCQLVIGRSNGRTFHIRPLRESFQKTATVMLVHRQARKDREQHRSSAADDLPNRVAKAKLVDQFDLGHSSDGPSSIDLAENRVNTTESRLAAAPTFASKSAIYEHHPNVLMKSVAALKSAVSNPSVNRPYTC
jgi:hypothetical protein